MRGRRGRGGRVREGKRERGGKRLDDKPEKT